MESKYDRIKRQLKEIEQSTSKVISEAERDKAIAMEKLVNSEQRRLELESKIKDENSSSASQITHLRD